MEYVSLLLESGARVIRSPQDYSLYFYTDILPWVLFGILIAILIGLMFR